MELFILRRFSLGYVCHLFRSRELLAYRLATIHNLTFMANLMKDIGEAIQEGRFEALKRDIVHGKMVGYARKEDR